MLVGWRNLGYHQSLSLSFFFFKMEINSKCIHEAEMLIKYLQFNTNQSILFIYKVGMKFRFFLKRLNAFLIYWKRQQNLLKFGLNFPTNHHTKRCKNKCRIHNILTAINTHVFLRNIVGNGLTEEKMAKNVRLALCTNHS